MLQRAASLRTASLRTALARRLAGSLAPCFALVACASPTQLVVVVDTNLVVPAELDEVEVVVTGPSGIRTGAVQSLLAADAPSFPLTLGVSPATDALGPVSVVAIGRRDGDDVVRAIAEVTLVAGETRTLTLVLVRGCVGRDCGGGRTCGPGGCASIMQDDLQNWEGVPPPFTSTDPCDSGAWDADGDGDPAAECGGADCDDEDPERRGSAVEDCDGVDNDCDGRTDPDCACTPVGAVEPCATACDSPSERTCEATGWGPCTFPSETCNAADDDCDGSVDEGFDYVALPETRVTDDATASSAPRLVFAEDRWALVWSDSAAGVRFARLAAGGTPTAAAVSIGTGAAPDLAWSGRVFGVVWTRRDTVMTLCGTEPCTQLLDRVEARVVDAEGGAPSAVVRVQEDVSTNPRVRVVWDGMQFVASMHHTALRLETFDALGAHTGGQDLTAATTFERADAVFTGTRLAYAYARGDNVYFIEGALGAFSPQVLVSAAARPSTASLDWTGSRFVEAWLTGDAAGSNDDPITLQVVALDPMGTPAPEIITLSPSVGGRDLLFNNVDPPTVRAAPGQVLVAWSDQRDGDQEIYFARLSPSGAVIQAATRASNGLGESETVSAAFDGREFGLAWRDDRDGNDEIYFTRLGCGL